MKKFWQILLTTLAAMCALCAFSACRERHVLLHHAEQSATCTKAGQREYWECTECGLLFADEKAREEISASELAIPPAHNMGTNNVCTGCGLFWAYTQGLKYGLQSGGTAYEVTGIGTASGDIVVPYFYEGLPVKAISSMGGYLNCTGLTGIKIPDSVTRIGRSAFAFCSNLTSIAIPNSVTEIDDDIDLFYGCNSLTSITVDSENERYHSAGNCIIETQSKTLIAGCKASVIPTDGSVTAIGDCAFSGCEYLTDIEIPDCMTSIGSCAFGSCENLTDITIPVGVSEMGHGVFQYCDTVTVRCEAASAPSGWDGAWNRLRTEEDPDGEFYDVYLSAVVWGCGNNDKDENGYVYTVIDGVRYRLKDGVATVAEQARGIGGDIAIPASVTYGEEEYSVTSIAANAFYTCNLTSVTIPSGVTFIGESAFNGCGFVTEIIIPNSVASVEKNAFYGRALTIYCEAAGAPDGWDAKWNGGGCPVVWDCKNNDKDEEGYVYTVADGVRYQIKDGVATVSKQMRNISGHVVIAASVRYGETDYSVTSIGEDAFFGFNITKVTIPDSVTSIGHYAFFDCDSLTGITIPDGVTSIGNQALSCSGSLTYIKIPDSVISIGHSLFASCPSLTGVTLPNDLAAIPDGMFSDCKSLTSITIPDGVTSIGWQAFANCSSLRSISIPSSVTTIKNEAFKGCDGLIQSVNGVQYVDKWVVGCSNKDITSVSLRKNTVGIANDAFQDCKALTNIILPDGITTIGRAAFEGCSNLTSVKIGNGIKSIGGQAFFGCRKLTSVTIGSGITSIEEEAFYNCGLTSITIPDGVTSIGRHAFWYTDLKSITIPISVTELDGSAFVGCSELENIIYQGTRAQWRALRNGSDWSSVEKTFTVRCSDGTLDKDGNDDISFG